MQCYSDIHILVCFFLQGNVIGISLRTNKKECPQNVDEVEMKLVSIYILFVFFTKLQNPPLKIW